MTTASQPRDVTIKSYILGLVLALVLTAIPFGLVAARTLPPAPTFAVIDRITQILSATFAVSGLWLESMETLALMMTAVGLSLLLLAFRLVLESGRDGPRPALAPRGTPFQRRVWDALQAPALPVAEPVRYLQPAT